VDRLGAMQQFVAVADSGSFSAAARLLGLGQPAVSKSVAALEERLAVRLFNRTTRALVLTDAGQAYLDHARIALDEADAAEAAASGSAQALTGRLRVAMPVTFGRLHAVPRLAAFLADHPGLDVELVMDDRWVDLVQEGVDVALRGGTLPDSGLLAQRLGLVGRRLVATPDFWTRHGRPATPADCARLPAVLFAGVAQWSFAREGEVQSVRLSPALRVNAAEGVRAALLAGLGCAIVSTAMVSDALADGRLEAALADWSLPSIDFWAVFPAQRRVSARARLFADFLRTVVAAVD
jgi:DNA-binding transcriptional LysR family regulator